MSLIFVIEDEPVMAECMALAVEGATPSNSDEGSSRPHAQIFYDAFSAMDGLREHLPDVILLDVMLVGPDGFAFLNEMVSYTDTARIPVILVTTLDLSGRDLSHYGVVDILDKASMTPDDIQNAIRSALERGQTLAQSENGLSAFNQQLGSGKNNAL